MIELLVRLAISMAVVMAVMGLAARFVRRRQEAGLGGGGFRWQARAGRGPWHRSSGRGAAGGPNTSGPSWGASWGAPRPRRARPIPPVEVVYRRALAKGAAVAVVEATGKQFLLGVTEQSITLLAELSGPGDAAPLDAHAAAPTNVAAHTAWAPSPASQVCGGQAPLYGGRGCQSRRRRCGWCPSERARNLG